MGRRRRVTTVELLQFSGFNDLADVCRTSMRRRKTDVRISTIRDGRTRPIDVGVLAGFGRQRASGSGAAQNQRELNADFMVWIALDIEPFSMVHNRGLRFFFGKNFPQLTIPHESTLRKSYAAEVYDKVMDKVKSDLASVTTINLLFDGWTDRHHAIHYMHGA